MTIQLAADGTDIAGDALVRNSIFMLVVGRRGGHGGCGLWTRNAILYLLATFTSVAVTRQGFYDQIREI
jgi:hypothetical protein